jgi:3-oxoisoapionate decarboxylase
MIAKRFGVGSYTWPWAVKNKSMTVQVIAERARAAGLSTIQLCDNISLEGLEPGDFPKGLTIELGTRGLASVPKMLDLAAKLDAPLLRLVIDTHDSEPEPGEIIETVSRFLPQLIAQNCTLAIENHDRLRAKTLAQIIEAIGSDFVGICLDTANSIGAGEGLETVLHHLAKHTVCLHLKDIQIRRVEHLMGFDVFGCEPGMGIVDFKATYAAMTWRCQSVILEQWPSEPSVEDAWAETGIALIRRFKSASPTETKSASGL